jgi:Carboxypeptidase regulatory-like domain/TonB dependent receptor
MNRQGVLVLSLRQEKPDTTSAMRHLARKLLLVGAALLGIGSPVFGQAVTGTIGGRVHSTDGLPLPGVTVAVTSAMLQGARTAVTSESGDYLIPLLPPGTYTVVFELDGFQSLKRTQQTAGAYNATVDVAMSPAAVREDVTVIADAQPLFETAQVATNFRQNLMAVLPSNRTIDAVLLMAPALHATGPRGAYTINGSQSYENLYTLDGAIINENLRGAPMNPYIEDALQEVTVASAGVSAEYGRFSGGIANAVTKSGGNTFSGSFRTSFANEKWRTYTPYESTQLIFNPSLKLKLDKTVPTYETTFGGPMAKDRLWFFLAMRQQQQESTRTTVSTNIPYVRTNDEKRYEGKLTYTLRPGHSVRGSYLYMDQVLKNSTGSNVMDLASLTNQGQPQDLYSVHYSGVLRPNLFVEAQYSARHLTFTDVGADTTDLIGGTMILDISKNARFWSPTFCSGATCDGDEQRNNSNIIVKGSSFFSTRSSGTHHLVFGYDYFNDNIWANTHASGSDYRIRATGSIFSGGVLYPQFIPGTTATSTMIEHTPIHQLSEGSNLRTHALFVNDSWRLSNNFSFGLGLRFDRNQATDGSGANVGDDMNLSPRLSVVWDPAADGRWSVSGSAARYVMALTSNLAGSTTAAGNAANYRWFYQGPAINASATGPLVDTATALQQLFDWLNANGGTGRRPYVLAIVPGFNMTMPEPLKSPYSIEYAGGVSRTLGPRASLRVDGVFREYKNLYSQRTDLSTGRVSDAAGNFFDRTFVENTNDMHRRYAALVAQGSYAADQFTLGGNYTLSRAFGNVDAETVNTGPSGASINHYPEYRRADWNHPDGDLAIDQRHRARGWATYTVPMNTSAGSLAFGLVQQVGSGVPYGAQGLINPLSFMANPGYALPPAQIEYFFTARDAFRTETSYRTDLSVNYSHRLRGTSEAFFHGEILNVFNQFQLCGCGDTVFNNGGVTNLTTIGQSVVVRPVPFNPYTTQPVQGVNWDTHTNFGQPASTFAFTTPRLYRFSIGVRF